MTHFSTTSPQAPLDLASGDRVNSMRPSDFIASGFTDAQIFDLPFLHELLYIAGAPPDCILYWRLL